MGDPIQPIRAVVLESDQERRREVAQVVWGMVKAVAFIGVGAWMLLELLQGRDAA